MTSPGHPIQPGPLGGRSPDGIEETLEGARQVLRSPEQVELHLPVAGPASRILAYVIDYLVIVLLIVAIFTVLILTLVTTGAVAEWLQEPFSEWLEDVDPEDPESILGNAFFLLFLLAFLLVQVVAEWGYFVVSEMASGGRSLGKAAVGLRVVRDGGLPITLRSSMVRNLLRIADVLPTSYLVGLTAMVASKEGKRLGDIAAGTLVVRLDRPAPAPPIEASSDGRAGEIRFDRAELARIGTNERALLRRTLRRLETLEGEAADGVRSRAVEALSARIGREPPSPVDELAFLHALWNATRRR